MEVEGVILKARLPEGKGCWLGSSSVQPPAAQVLRCRTLLLLCRLPGRRGWRGQRLKHRPRCARAEGCMAGGEQTEKTAEWVFAHAGFGVVFVY